MSILPRCICDPFDAMLGKYDRRCSRHCGVRALQLGGVEADKPEDWVQTLAKAERSLDAAPSPSGQVGALQEASQKFSAEMLAKLPPIPDTLDPNYWKLMYERREMEAHLLGEEIIRLRRAATPSAGDDAVMRDALRYRHLREQQWNTASLFVVAGSKDSVRLGTDCPSLARLDEAVDEAIRAAMQEGS